MQQDTRKTNKAAFTLVEIMVVVAIIGLLAAIGIPSFQRARANSLESAKLSNARVVDGAIEQLAMENALSNGSFIVAAELDNYIKGGSASLKVGQTDADLSSLTVGQIITPAVLY